MATLTAMARKRLLSDEFGLPGERKYPVNDRAHAANAKARAKQQLGAGHISRAQYDEIVAKANRKLHGR